MGGKTNATKGKVRKTNDRVDMKPVSRGDTSGDGSSGTSGSSAVCPLSFEIALPESTTFADGTPLLIRHRDAHWFVTARGQNVVAFRKDKASMLAQCLEQGHRYSGTVTTKAKKKYGEFQRSG